MTHSCYSKSTAETNLTKKMGESHLNKWANRTHGQIVLRNWANPIKKMGKSSREMGKSFLQSYP